MNTVQSQSKTSEQIKREFARKAKWFYSANAVLAMLLAVAIYFSKHSQYQREAFIFIVVVFLIWIFNVDKIYRCPNCGGVPRGKEGLIYLPKQCAVCDVSLRD